MDGGYLIQSGPHSDVFLSHPKAAEEASIFYSDGWIQQAKLLQKVRVRRIFGLFIARLIQM